MFIYISNDICSLQKDSNIYDSSKIPSYSILFKGIKDGIYFINNNSK